MYFLIPVDCERCDLTQNPAGFMADPCSCTNFYRCVLSAGVWISANLMSCPICTRWDQGILNCVHDPTADTSICQGHATGQENVMVSGGVYSTLVLHHIY